jgi:hypothetical protein
LRMRGVFGTSHLCDGILKNAGRRVSWSLDGMVWYGSSHIP